MRRALLGTGVLVATGLFWAMAPEPVPMVVPAAQRVAPRPVHRSLPPLPAPAWDGPLLLDGLTDAPCDAAGPITNRVELEETSRGLAAHGPLLQVHQGVSRVLDLKAAECVQACGNFRVRFPKVPGVVLSVATLGDARLLPLQAGVEEEHGRCWRGKQRSRRICKRLQARYHEEDVPPEAWEADAFCESVACSEHRSADGMRVELRRFLKETPTDEGLALEPIGAEWRLWPAEGNPGPWQTLPRPQASPLALLIGEPLRIIWSEDVASSAPRTRVYMTRERLGRTEVGRLFGATAPVCVEHSGSQRVKR